MLNRFFLFLFLSLFVRHNPVHAETSTSQTVYISLVPKNSVSVFLNRFATAKHHLVVTRTPVSVTPIQSLKVNVPAGKRLFIAEIPPEARWKVIDHLGKIDRYYVLAFDEQIQPHNHDPLHAGIYLEAVATEETLAPALKTVVNGVKPATHGSIPPVTAEFLSTKTREYSGDLPVMIDGTSTRLTERGSPEGRKKAVAYLAAFYRDLGFTVSYHHFGTDGINVIAEKAGADPSRVLLVTSHLDSVSNPGADDDGAGTVSAMAIARSLAKVPLNHTLRIVAFDQEERGLVGSKAYVKWLNERNELAAVLGVINLEMTAWDSDNDGAFHAIDCNENQSGALTQQLVAAIAHAGLNIHRTEACTNRSDHASFWRYNVPAIVISENFFNGDGNPCYHRSCDQVTNLNWDYMTTLTRAMTWTVADLLAPQAQTP